MKSIHRFWVFGLTSLLLYLLICIAVNRTVFSKRPVPGFWPLPELIYEWLFVALAVAGMACLPIVYLLKIKWATKAPNDAREDGSLLGNTRARRFLVAFMLCDTTAAMGLILFLIQGRMGAVLFFGILGLLNYAMAYPGQAAKTSDEC